MVVATHWWAVVVFAFAMTLAWLFIEERVTTTALLSGATWSYAALTGAELTRYTESGQSYTVTVGEIRYVAIFLALLSFLVLLLYRLGHYPPTEDDPYTESQGEIQ